MTEDSSNTTIKFGAGYDVPWFVARGTVEEQKQQITEASGISGEGKTLFELSVEAALYAIGLTNAANGVGAKPAKRAQGGDAVGPEAASAAAKVPPGTTPEQVRESIAEKAAKAQQEPEQAEPSDVTGNVFDDIDNAGSRDAMLEIHKNFVAGGGTWTAEHKRRAQARIAELEK